MEEKAKEINIAIETLEKDNSTKEESIKMAQGKTIKSKEKVDSLSKKIKDMNKYSEDLIKINKDTKISLQEMPLVNHYTERKQFNEITEC